MDNLFIESSGSTPEVYFNRKKNVLKIEGQSYPENAFKFYQPIIDWIERYLNELDERAVFEFSFHYLNTSSTKCIMNVIDLLEDAYENGKEPVLNWYYDDSNKDMLEIAQEFKEDIRFNFNIISLNQKLKIPLEFKTENDTLGNIEYVLKKYSKEKDTSPIFTEFLKLGKSYKKLLRQIVKLTHISDKQQEHLLNTKKELEDKTASLTTLLDHAGQGFLSFGTDLVIDGEYSLECETILNCIPSGRNFVELVFQDDKIDKVLIHKTLVNIIDAFTSNNRLRLKVYLSLLPEKAIINERHIKLEYKLLENSKKIMVILTDISEKVLFEKKLKEEERILRVTVNLVANQAVIKELYQSFKSFILRTTAKTTIEKNDLQKIYRTVHTFKGSFGQHYLFYTANSLHQLEDRLNEMLMNFDKVSTSLVKDLLSNHQFVESFRRDLEESEKLLGENYFNLDDNRKLILIDKSEIIGLSSKLSANTTGLEILELKDKLYKLTYVSLKDNLNTFASYLQSAAEYFDKKINPFIVEGDDIKLNFEIYSPILNTIGHLFRNSIIHGIEPAYERVARGKPESGNINCSIKRDLEWIIITFSDDGYGVDPSLVTEKLLDNNLITQDKLSSLSDEEIVNFIFIEGFSTSDNVTDIAGRGVGLSEIKTILEEFGGNIRLITEKDKGTEFILTLPYID